MNNILLDLLTFGSVLSGILVITARSPIISVLFLIAVFVNVAGYLILLGINFIGLIYIIIYVGAIAILFLFVIMMIPIRLAELHEINQQHLTRHYPLAFILGTIFIMIIPDVSAVSLRYGIIRFFDFINFSVYNIKPFGLDNNALPMSFGKTLWSSNFISFEQIDSLGLILYTSHSIYLLLGAVILLLAMIGPIILTYTRPNDLHFRDNSYNPLLMLNYKTPLLTLHVIDI
jgi:NADH-ubiquinone oxidoreductase chain 6